jgi:MATE family multidrug resistance protein
MDFLKRYTEAQFSSIAQNTDDYLAEIIHGEEQDFPITRRKAAWRILILALPIIGGMVSQNLLNLVDTAMVGQLGASALGAVGFGGMANWFASSFFMGLGAGVQTIVSRRTGEGRPQQGILSLHTAMSVVVCVVIPFSIILSLFSTEILALLSTDPEVRAQGGPYLGIRLMAMSFVIFNFSFRGYWNGIGRTTVYLLTIVLMHALNIFLNWMLIYGHLGAPRLEVKGAAIASAISLFVGTVIYFFLAFRLIRKDGFLARIKGFRKTLKNLLRLSIPAGMQNVFFSLGFVVFFVIAQKVGTDTLAATNVLLTLSLVCILPSVGFGLAAATLVGQSLGEGQLEAAKRWGWQTLAISTACMSVFGVILALFPELWLSFLMNDPEVELMAVAPLILLGLLQPFDGVGVVLSQTLIGAGAVRTVMFWSVICQWGVFLPLAYIWGVVYGGGLLSIWISLVIWRVLFSAIMAWTYRRGHWLTAKV